jgi:hypothetical protein
VDELELVRLIRRRAGKSPGLVLGIGDDCAILRPRAGDDLLFTTDQMIEGVHFRSDASADEIGHRALARSLSDIAAMGGEPRFCLVSLAIPQKRGTAWIESFYRGLLGLARRTKTALAGGDLAHASSIYCDVMVCGAHMSGLPLNKQLLERSARQIASTRTAPVYRFYALPGGPPFRPGLVQVSENGVAIDVEVWRMPLEHFGSFVAGIPAPLGIGKVRLEDGSLVSGFLCESLGVAEAADISGLGGWRQYLRSLPKT